MLAPRPFTAPIRCILLLTLPLGCSAEVRGSRALATSIDSAGVTIVENREAAWSNATAWRLTETPMLVIPSTQREGAFLQGVRGPRRLSTGALVLGDAGSRQLRFHDEAGTELQRVGRAGAGPGEFQSMGGVYRCASDTLLVTQRGQLSVWTATGSYVRTHPVATGVDGWFGSIRAVAPDCRSLLVEESRAPPSQATERFSQAQTRLVWQSITGEQRRIVASYGGRRGVRVSWMGREFVSLLPWSAVPAFAVSGTDVVYGLTDRPEYQTVRPDGSTDRIVRWAQVPAPITPADRARFDQSRSEFLRLHPEETPSFPPLALLAVPKSKPVYAQIVADDAGHVWIREYAERDAGFAGIFRADAGQTLATWRVFDASGRLLGTIDVPAALDIREITEGAVLGVHFDEDETETVRVFRIIKP